MNIRFFILSIKDQFPFKRFIRNFIITRKGWGVFRRSSHIRYSTNTPKVAYNTKASADKAKLSMEKKYNKSYSSYRCLYCGKYHIGSNG